MKRYLSNYKNTTMQDYGNPNFVEKEKQDYLRFISEFISPHDLKVRMGKEIKNLQEYDLLDQESVENRINGHLEKRFIRLPRNNFNSYFDAVKFDYPNISYVSYLDDKDIISGKIPQNISVLLKKINVGNFFDDSIEKRKMYSEKVCPKIMNFFGLKTVYNETKVMNDSFYILSLDFIKPGQFYCSSTELDDNLPFFAIEKLETNLESLRTKVDLLKQKIKEELEQEDIDIDYKAIEESYLKEYLVRALLIGDRDVRSKNYGFIYDYEKRKIENFVNYDYEFGFNIIAQQMYNSKHNIEFIFKNYPKVADWFKEKLLQFLSEDKYGNSFADYLFDEEISSAEISDEFLGLIKRNAKFLLSEFENLKQNQAESQKQ